MLPQVVKRNGEVEPFNPINLSKVGLAAGLTPEQAKQLVEKLTNWAKSLQVNQLTSIQIRDKFLEELPAINQDAADLYKWYEQSKEQ